MNRIKGIAMILSGAALWGATGPLMEWILEIFGLSVSFLLTWPLLAEPGVSWGIFAVIIIGTLAFILFLSSMRFISPVETSILSAFEPLTAMIISAIWFGQFLAPVQIGGTVIMLVFVTWLSFAGKGKVRELAEG